MSIRHVLTLCAALCACFLSSCGGGAADKTSLTAAPGLTALEPAQLTITAADRAEMEAALPGSFSALLADPALGGVRSGSPPPISAANGGPAGTASFEEASRDTSGYKRWNWARSCKQHSRKYCWSCKFKRCDCCDKSNCEEKDDDKKCKNPCKRCNQSDCKKKGDKCDNACKGCGRTDCKHKGNKCKNPCRACDRKDCKHKGDKCQNPCKRCGKQDCKPKGDDCPNNPPPPPPPPPCVCEPCAITGITCETERFWVVDDCCDRQASVEYVAKVTFNCETPNKDGITVTFKRDGNVLGTALTDADGVATFIEENVPAGQWNTQVCVDKSTVVEPEHGDCVPCKDDKNKCKWHYSGNNAGDDAVVNPGSDVVCTDCTVVVYHECVEGKVTGKGMIDFEHIDANGNTVAAMGSFMFRLVYDDGNFSGTFTYTDRIHPTLRDVPITWMVMDGADAWFGTENVMIHVHDAGMPKPNPGDFFEIWQWDQDFHAGGNLHNCFIRNSFRYSYDCP
jgi:hypothetical protein